LANSGQLIEINSEVDPYLEMAEIHRRVFDNQGPAILYNKVKGSPFRAASNLYGTKSRTKFIFRKSLQQVKEIIKLKADPSSILKNPLKAISLASSALTGLPIKKSRPKGLNYRCKISDLPQIVSWPDDGGAFITLPQVITTSPNEKSILKSNVGMYRIQLSGNDYEMDNEVGLHYQLHRGIGIHHQEYNDSKLPFLASIFVGGPPSHSFAAIMPLPEGLSELTFAGLLNNRRFRYCTHEQHLLSLDADFVITGEISKNIKKPEGPFGDHLGYYSLAHDFPVMKIHEVYHKKNPIWHFTVVGRPPQEDSSFGYLIHDLVGDLLKSEFPGIVDVNAVDAAGVHPLLLAIGQERYMPFREKKPEEIITMAHHLLGKGQTSLAKYLLIIADDDDPNTTTENIECYFNHILKRVRWERDLHFITNTTIDTLDYSGSGWNEGSKVMIASRGPILRELSESVPEGMSLPDIFQNPNVALGGVLALKAPSFKSHLHTKYEMGKLSEHFKNQKDLLSGFPLIVVCDDTEFLAKDLDNFLWVTFTRSNPAYDIYGVDSFMEHKHWGCNGSLIIDARTKTHHAPELIPDNKVKQKVDKLFAKGGDLYGKI
jgi:4-hydroxy-3-polyprenylbenzoate decarboxylase